MLLLCAGAASGQTPEVVARAASVTGRTLLYSAGGGALALTPGYILTPGDRIDTRGGGRVVIDLSDGSMVVVQPESLVILKDFRHASSLRELLEITVGIVRVKINHFGGRPNPYRMNSPTASIAVRGTEFSIEVAPDGGTRVVVYEGAVEVTSISDPSHAILLEAGRGVLVRPGGQDFRLFTPGPGRPGDFDNHNDGDGDHDRQGTLFQPPAPGGNGGNGPPHDDDHQLQAGNHADHDDPSPRANASTYDRYIAGLADIAQVPFLFRYNAFSERHLDALENPAMATGFTTGEGRIFLLPSFSGVRSLQEYQAAFGPGGTLPADYSVSPQISMFNPVGGGFVVGGSASGSRVGETGGSGNATTSFYSGSLVAARLFGRNSFGIELESLRGTGSLLTTAIHNAGAAYGEDASGSTTPALPITDITNTASRVTQTGLTAGFSRDLSRTANVGVFYRYAFISATDADVSHTINGIPAGLNSTDATGHTSEMGVRLRGLITQRLSYGIAGAWLGASLGNALVQSATPNSHGRDRAQRSSLAIGLGYALTPRVVLALDLAGGAARTWAGRTQDLSGATLQNGTADGHFVSLHTAVQADLTRRLFVSASLLNVWQKQSLNVALFPDSLGQSALVVDSFFPIAPGGRPVGSHFSDYGVGWRFSPRLFLEYVYSTDYGVDPGAYSLMLRYTFGLRRE